MSYTITIQDFPEIPANARHEAERRFSRTLERALGSDDVVPAYKAWTLAEDGSESDLSEEERGLAVRWLKAATRARQEGFNGLGDAPEAYFEVRLDR